MSGPNKDKIMIALSLVSILFIGFIVVINYPNPEKELSGTNYYTSDETTTLGQREGSSYDALITTGRVECPGIGNDIPEGGLISTTGVTTSVNAYSVVYLPYTQECSGIGLDSLNQSNFSTYVKKTDAKPLTVSEMFSGGSTAHEGSYTEIVAPFAFMFETSNVKVSNSENQIIISNRSGNCKMVITNPANWYCAGTVGTKTEFSNIEDPCSWEEHGNHHMTRIGYGYEGYDSGSAGDLIAYGNANTTIEFRCFADGKWQTLCLWDVCKTSRAY